MAKRPQDESSRGRVTLLIVMITAIALALLRMIFEFRSIEVLKSLGVVSKTTLEGGLQAAAIFLALYFHQRLVHGRSSPDHDSTGPASLSVAAQAAPALTVQSECDMDAGSFIQRLSLATVRRIDVIAITGEITIRNLCEALEQSQGKQVINLNCRVLLRSDSASDSRRVERKRSTREALRRVRQALPGFDYEVREYGSVLPLRGIIVEHIGGAYSAYLSFYDWRDSETMTTRESQKLWCYERVEVAKQDRLLSVYASWFEHLWGHHNLHTLVFDFDDTLFRTCEIVVESWSTALTQSLSHGWIKADDVCPAVRPSLQDEAALRTTVRDMYLRVQHEHGMIAELLLDSASAESVRLLRELRQRLREDGTCARATPIQEICSQLRRLSRDYQLVIASATSEKTIQFVLEKHDLDIFSFIFGRDVGEARHGLEGKTPNLLRASSMTGIPVNRMALIGDADSDYRAARQIGMHFIEARSSALFAGRESLVHSRPAGEAGFTCDAGAGDLVAALAQIEAVIARRGSAER